MEQMAISDFKARCQALLEQVRRTRKPIRVTRFGKPVAEVVPPLPSGKGAEWPGSMADAVEILWDIVSPVVKQRDWEALRE